MVCPHASGGFPRGWCFCALLSPRCFSGEFGATSSRHPPGKHHNIVPMPFGKSTVSPFPLSGKGSFTSDICAVHVPTEGWGFFHPGHLCCACFSGDGSSPKKKQPVSSYKFLAPLRLNPNPRPTSHWHGCRRAPCDGC